MTYTYAILHVSRSTYEEIRTKLEAAGYSQAFHTHEGEPTEVIDMHGIGLSVEPTVDPTKIDVTVAGEVVPAEGLVAAVSNIRDAVQNGRMSLKDGQREVVRLAQLKWTASPKDRS